MALRSPSHHEVRPLLLWAAIAIPPIAWTAHLILGYVFVALQCHTGAAVWGVLVVALTALTFLATLASGVLAVWSWTRTDTGTRTEGDNPLERGGFMAVWGFLMSLVFGVLILAGGLPTLFLPACPPLG